MRIRLILFLLIGILLQQCAKQTAPSGGPKDETPPTLKGSYPKHEQTNFRGDQIELSFDEHVQLNNAREQIIITPSVGKKFEATANKGRVTLKLNARLQENTTYSVNFREAIQDVTERNPTNAKLAFSTGDYIDSLSINGKISDALSEKLLANTVVALAEASDTFNIFKHAASWLTVTDKKGFFSLENLKPGKYLLYAFDDKSKNMIVDSKNEKYGFISQPITLTNNLDSLKIRLFKLDINPLKLITARTTFAYFNVRFSKSLIDYKVQAVDSSIQVYSSLESDLTTVKIYNTIPTLDSLQIRVRATDSLNYKVDTLLYMKFPKKEATRDKFTAKLETPTLYESNSVLSATMTFNKPITKFNRDSVYIQVDSLTRIPFTEADYTWQRNNSVLQISKKLDLLKVFPPDSTMLEKPKPGESTKGEVNKNERSKTQADTRPAAKPKPKPELVLAKGAFVSIEADTAQRANAVLTVSKAESLAILDVKVETEENFIIQLINRTDKIVRESINQKDVSFENLNAETYVLRVVIDLNKNGKWDAGNVISKTEPEPIVYYRNPKGLKEISLKPNWHLGPLLIKY